VVQKGIPSDDPRECLDVAVDDLFAGDIGVTRVNWVRLHEEQPVLQSLPSMDKTRGERRGHRELRSRLLGEQGPTVEEKLRW